MEMKSALNGQLSQWINGWTFNSHPERVPNLREFADNYDWSGLEFPVSIKGIRKFEVKNGISVNILGSEGKDIYIHRNSNYDSDREINLLMISENGVHHY